jgi:hypothetical protein
MMGKMVATFSGESLSHPFFSKHKKYVILCLRNRGRDSIVSVATRYGLDGAGIESQWGRDFLLPSRPALGPTQPSVNGYLVSF